MPRPIPGIPYHKASIRPFGDVPDMLKSQAKTREAARFVLDRIRELQEPVFQLFIEPFGKPWVILADSVTTEHILVHRSHELDLSVLFSALFTAVAPTGMITKKTSSPVWKVHRRFMADTMSYQFLHENVGPHILSSCRDLVQLWTQKERLCRGHPFDGATDIADLLMDSIWAVVFGEKFDLLHLQTRSLMDLDALTSDTDSVESLVQFPKATRPEASKLVRALAASSEVVHKSPLRSFAHKVLLLCSPVLRRAVSFKDKFIGIKLREAKERFATGADLQNVKSVTDLLVDKEISNAKKEGRIPIIDSPMIRDELWTFFLGAHDTTGTTIQWGLKYLTLHQDVQSQARTELQAIFGGNQAPNTTQIANANLPYLDSCNYEILRHSTTAVFLSRDAEVDLDILGYRIPKGTTIIMPLGGPGYLSPRLNVKTDLKDPWIGNWDPEELHLFKPSRWLLESDGQLKFDQRAGPNHLFAAGPRACFGKRMALLDLRLVMATILLNFELQPISENLTDFAAEDILTHHPQRVLIRPRKI